jgi:hypothetical protein
MAEGFITRRGGVAAERTAAPSINFISKTGGSITVTFTNNEANEVDVFYGITSSLTDKVTLASTATSGNITFSGLDPNTPYTISAYAIVTDATLKKIKSEIITTSVTTDDVTYIEATGGTTTTYEDNGTFYKSHTFTSGGNFVVNSLSNQPNGNDVDYLIIAGGGSGGAGGNTQGGGGGGAGGYRTTLGTSGGNSTAESKITLNAQTYGITIGAGGASVSTEFSIGNNGTNSSALGITSTAGGAGGGATTSGQSHGLGNDGGSGGGNGTNYTSETSSGISGQGFGGGIGSSGGDAGGGGGGATSEGQDAASGSVFGGDGGNGLSNILRTGLSESRAGGGGGGGAGSSGDGGTGGGGDGGVSSGTNGGSGTSNTGSGGGGGGNTQGGDSVSGSGGSGIVIIRYEVEAL